MSRTSRDNPKADWYVWHDPKPGHVGAEREWPGDALSELSDEVLLANHPGRGATDALLPWEARVVRLA
ncbi:hypothetical protein [Tessaracoccus caeni]|uniref:hypothetical protein n=1 Tax=Tessaracoccus caeni TaxID=3031239 RepID=UPI0023D9F2E4|nr:hypothetical protein [Tessaracoccus caeni]MDF1489015.1 hypothetical protein [Tessaracoccus caeni]